MPPRSPPRGPASTASLERPPQGSGHVLLVRTAEGLEVVPVTRREVVVGRERGCDVVIDDESISRRHARIRFGGSITVEDLGSHNGTFVAGRRLAPNEPAELRVHEALGIAGVQIFIEPAPARPRAPAKETAPREGVVVRDPAMAQLYAVLEIVAMSPLRVLVLGETGVGKDVFARTLHAKSSRAGRPFLALSCAALAESTLEAELFGYERGAFTGAVQAKPGLFEAADGGTLFLDEIGELPASTQVKLLRVLESGEVLRLGSLAPRTVDVRIVSATNRDLRARVADGAFRSDLYFRLNGTTMVLPPLRERVTEIEPLARSFAAAMAASLGRAAPKLERGAIEKLEGYAWPGNVRELKNVIERAVVLRPAGAVRAEDLVLEGQFEAAAAARPGAPAPAPAKPPDGGLWGELEVVERQRIVDALAATAGNQSAAAKRLGIARATLIKRIEQFGLARPKKR
jgi:transcriptional regulator with GAF, ATPase, and Fis domain